MFKGIAWFSMSLSSNRLELVRKRIEKDERRKRRERGGKKEPRQPNKSRKRWVGPPSSRILLPRYPAHHGSSSNDPNDSLSQQNLMIR